MIAHNEPTGVRQASGLNDRKRFLTRSAIIFFMIILTHPVAFTPALADGDEWIEAVKVEVAQGELIVSARLTSGFHQEIVNEIQNGIQKDFYYYILLKKKEKNWFFDEEILSRTILYTVKYDTLKKKYKVVLTEGEKVVENILDDLEAMKRMVSQVDHIKLAPVSIMKSRHRYYVSVKVQMKAAKLPFYLDYFLFFIPFLELDTPWSDSGTISLQRGR